MVGRDDDVAEDPYHLWEAHLSIGGHPERPCYVIAVSLPRIQRWFRPREQQHFNDGRRENLTYSDTCGVDHPPKPVRWRS
jgi:hypothetical protein